MYTKIIIIYIQQLTQMVKIILKFDNITELEINDIYLLYKYSTTNGDRKLDTKRFIKITNFNESTNNIDYNFDFNNDNTYTRENSKSINFNGDIGII